MKNKIYWDNTKLSLRKASPSPHGFALISTISIMVLLIIVTLALSNLSSVSEKTTSESDLQSQARANARLALEQAIAQLQQYAGPDQRSTATASILNGQNMHPQAPNSTSPYSAVGSSLSITSETYKSRWTGIWNTQSYIQATPDSKEFIQWLISGSEVQQESLAEAEVSISTSAANFDENFMTIFEGFTTVDDVIVPKVPIIKNAATTGRYAYWTEDLGVKASLSWNEAISTASDEEKQYARLSSAPGIDYSIFEGPFDTGTTEVYSNDNLNTAWLDQINQIINTSDSPLLLSSYSSNGRDWLKENRHDIDVGNMGLLADMKLGGLKRDLSLAFEMDGDEENGELIGSVIAPVLFNQQYGEFVDDPSASGYSDRHTSPENAHTMGDFHARYLYRDTYSSNDVFSSDIDQFSHSTREAVVRGPNWWAIRDYANLYKRLRQPSANSYTIDPRSHLSKVYSTYTSVNRDYSPRNAQINDNGVYIDQPIQAKYAPVLLGTSFLISIKRDASSGQLSLVADPFFHIWNPYNVNMEVDRYAISLPQAMAGSIALKITPEPTAAEPTPSPVLYGPDSIINLFIEESGYSNGSLTYLLSDVELASGEVMIVSPSDLTRSIYANTRNDELFPGINVNNASGIHLTQFPSDSTLSSITYDTLTVQDNDTIELAYTRGNFVTVVGGRHNSYAMDILTYLPPSGTLASDLINTSSLGSPLQFFNFNGARRNTSIPEVYDGSAVSTGVITGYIGGDIASDLNGVKQFFGICSHMTRPAFDDRPYLNNSTIALTPAALEVFSNFNPLSYMSDVLLGRPAQLNQMITQVCMEGGFNTLIDECAIDFAPDPDPTDSVLPTAGFFGDSFHSTSGLSNLPFYEIPVRPIHSLVSLRHAGIAYSPQEPVSPIGDSFASIYIDSLKPYGTMNSKSYGDKRWLINDALFDRYYFSGLAADFQISSSGYSVTTGSSLAATISNFYGNDFSSAKANPALKPYIPTRKNSADIVNELTAADGSGFKKLGAYAMVNGMFNVNSTSVKAWEALLKANRGISIDYKDSASSYSSNDTPFPNNSNPSIGQSDTDGDGNSDNLYGGIASLTDTEIQLLATEIVEQVKLRGPFMSLSDFINRKTGGSTVTPLHRAGAIQAAIDETGITDSVQSIFGEETNYETLLYSGNTYFSNPNASEQYSSSGAVKKRKTTTGLPKDITQANILLPLAPKLNARSDTFRIRAYGEVLDSAGDIVATAICEATIQRIPEYVNDSANDPWDDPMEKPVPLSVLTAKSSADFNSVNQTWGRKFKIVHFRWLTNQDI